MIVYKRLGLVK